MEHLPKLGVGVGFRQELKPGIFLNRDKIEFLEIISDHFFDTTRGTLEELDLLQEHFTLIPHSLDLSLGSAEGVDENYLEKLVHLVERIQPPWFSDHVCFTKSNGINIGHLAPLPFTKEAIGVFVRNVEQVRKRIPTPLILENITYNIRYSSSEMSEAAFLGTLLDATDCGLLLDVTNLYINSINLNFDWRRFLDEIPLERVVQIHFVGSRKHGDLLIDAHADKTDADIWDVFLEVCKRCDIKGAVLERDENFPSFAEIVSELETGRKLLENTAARQHSPSYVLS